MDSAEEVLRRLVDTALGIMGIMGRMGWMSRGFQTPMRFFDGDVAENRTLRNGKFLPGIACHAKGRRLETAHAL